MTLVASIVAVLVVGAINIKGEETKVGTVMAFTTYFTIILNAMLTITRIFMVFSRSLASLTRISYILDMKEDLKVEDIEPKESEYFIEFNNVDFSYNKKELNLENINFKLKHGQTLGIIGATGSGKTTIINLLMRFYDIDSGEILINGRNVKSIDAKELKDMFGIAFQNDTIFSDTIKENIVFGRNISDDDLQKAIKVSQAHDFIYNQKEGLETILTPKGTNISGGQKQRLYIARALANNPEILILDDSSSALDYKTDSLLRQEIQKNYNTTTIIIAQRISSIKHSDFILVLDEGKTVGYGTHEQLMETSSIYNEIYQSQMGGGINE